MMMLEYSLFGRVIYCVRNTVDVFNSYLTVLNQQQPRSMAAEPYSHFLVVHGVQASGCSKFIMATEQSMLSVHQFV